MRRHTRILIYWGIVAVVTYGGFMIGNATFDCPPGAYECDMAVRNAMAGGVIGFVVAVVGCVIAEVVRVREARRGPRTLGN
ncbi:MAG: hypothetical protein HZY75_07550 [Nocardioidaceae bacterium]|nr:MAG: hypothetical protein HZY75_07550 [Nocardioidaceae bacterium]